MDFPVFLVRNKAGSHQRCGILRDPQHKFLGRNVPKSVPSPFLRLQLGAKLFIQSLSKHFEQGAMLGDTKGMIIHQTLLLPSGGFWSNMGVKI